MPAGFQILGENGNTQIDENYFNFACVAKGSIVMPAATNEENGSMAVTSVNLTLTAYQPMLFINPKNTMAAVQRIKVTGNSHEFRIVGGLTEGSLGLAETFSYFLFDRPPTPPEHGAGIQVYNTLNECVFDSNYPPMRFVDVITTPTNLDDAEWTYPSGDFAVAIGQGRRCRVDHPTANQAGMLDVFRITPTQVRLKLKYYQFGGPGSGSEPAGGGGKAIVIDVSRL